VIAAGHVLERMKVVTPQRAAWVCIMRVRLLQMAHLMLGKQSPELDTDYKALDADRSALKALICGFRHSENDVASPDVAAGSGTPGRRDCRAELGHAQQAAVTAGNGMFKLGASLYDARPMQIDEVVHALQHAYGFYLMDSIGESVFAMESILSAQKRSSEQFKEYRENDQMHWHNMQRQT
jgi:hypothetical protein